MALPEFEDFTSMLLQARRDQQSWGNLFAEIRRGDIANVGPEYIAARKFLSESGLIPVLSVWDFHSSPLLDQAAALLGIKSWQLTEFIESVRESCLIAESDLVVYEETPSSPQHGIDAVEPVPLGSLQRESSDPRRDSPQRPSAPTAFAGNKGVNLQLTVLWFIVGLLVSLVLVLLSSNRNGLNQGANPRISPVSPPPAQPVEPDALPKRSIPELPPPQRPQSEPAPETRPAPQSQPQASVWQACQQDEVVETSSPQPGETWWPVVGPAEALQDAKLHCRSDAFLSARTGKVQIASFRDRAVAARFAEQLSADNSHPWSFEVGSPRVLGSN